MSNVKRAVFSVLAISVLGAGCNGGGSPTPQATQAPVSPSQFVSQIVSEAQSGEISANYANTTLLKSPTLVNAFVFVIYNSSTQQDMAVTLEYSGDFNAEQYVAAFVARDQTQTNTPPSGMSISQFNSFSSNLVAADAQQPGLYINSQGTLYSQDSQTRDTDLQQAQIQNQDFLSRAAKVSTNYQMSFSSALQLTLLADKINATTEQALTDQDRQAITQTTLSIAGVSSSDLTTAVTASMSGDDTASNNLVTKISQNLGMPSDTTLRNKILPLLGVSLSQ
jgi:hypothetical protein